MKTSTTDSRWSGFKRRMVTVAVLVGITGNQVGCACECATVATLATAAAAAGLVVYLAREALGRDLTEALIEELYTPRGRE